MPGKHALLECIVCQKYPIRSDNMTSHMKTHGKSNQKGYGLWTQKVNEKLKRGYGLKSKYDLDERKHDKVVDLDNVGKYVCKRNNRTCADDDHNESTDEHDDSEAETEENEDDSDSDAEKGDDSEVDENDSPSDGDGDGVDDRHCDDDELAKYVWKRNVKSNRQHSPLLPRDIRAIIVGKSGAGKSVFLTYLLLEPDMMDYDNLIVCGPSLHQPLYNIMDRAFAMNLSKDQVRHTVTNQDYVENAFGSVDNFLDHCQDNRRCDGGINAEFIEDVDLIPDPSEFDVKKKNVLVLDDVLLGPQNKIEDMYTRGRHNGVDTFYLAQNYFKIPRQTVRENANFIVLFPQDMKNLNHIYNDHCSGDGISCTEFHDFCSSVWRSGKHKYVILDLTRDADKGKYRTNLKQFWNLKDLDCGWY